jgi:ribonuclease P protein component
LHNIKLSIITLKKRAEFLAVTEKGSKAVAKGLVLFANTSKTQTARVGFIVTKKLGNAVKRNRIKRRLRAVWQIVIKDCINSRDYVILARSSAFDRDFKDLVNDLIYTLKKCDSQASSI